MLLFFTVSPAWDLDPNTETDPELIVLITLAVLAVFCVGVVASATAFADEGLEFVNKEGKALVKNQFSSAGGVASLFSETGTITCTSSTDHGIITSTTGGEATILFKGCTTKVGATTLKCKGGKDAAGEAKAEEIITLVGILTTPSNKGTERLLLLTILEPGTLKAGITTFECEGVKIEVRGSLLTSNNYKTKALSKEYTLEFKVNAANKFVQSVTESENSKGEKIKCKGLESNTAGGGFKPAGEETTDKILLLEEGQFI